MRRRRRDAVISQLARQLAESREQNGVLLERLAWYAAAVNGEAPPLRLVTPKPRAARRLG